MGDASTAIGGLTADNYFAIVEGGQLKLAENFENALKGDAIELTSAGTGDNHSFVNSSHTTNAEARSGAAGGKIGVAGSVAVNVAEGRTPAPFRRRRAITVRTAGRQLRRRCARP